MLKTVPPDRPLPALEAPPKGEPARTVSLPATSETRVRVGESAEQVLIENRERAERQLARSLAREYTAELELDARQRLAALEPARREAAEAAEKEVRGIFEEYASQRAPKVARLAAIVGFPDPNPRSLPPRRAVDAPAQKLLDEAQGLRGEIAELDSRYEERVRQTLAAAQEKYQVDLTDLQAQLALERADAVARAEANAEKEAHEAFEKLRPALIQPQEVVLPGAPARSQTLPAVPAPPDPPDVRGEAVTPEQRLKLIEAQLDVWLAARGYERSQTKAGARDATREFIQWREERGL